MSEMDPREAKLPVWARRELQVLRNKISALQRDMATATGAVKDATVFVDHYGPDPIPVGNDRTPVKFQLGHLSDNAIEVVVGDHGLHGQRAVQVRSSHGPVLLTPQASNVVIAWVGER